MSFVDVIYEEKDFQRVNLAPYRDVMSKMKIGVTATLKVPTGDINPRTHKGSEAVKHERAFRAVAKELDVGLSVSHNNMPDGNTLMSLGIGQKREFTPEAMKKREDALERSRVLKLAQKKVDAGMAKDVAMKEAVAERRAAVAATAKNKADKKAEADKIIAAQKAAEDAERKEGAKV